MPLLGSSIVANESLESSEAPVLMLKRGDDPDFWGAAIVLIGVDAVSADYLVNGAPSGRPYEHPDAEGLFTALDFLAEAWRLGYDPFSRDYQHLGEPQHPIIRAEKTIQEFVGLVLKNAPSKVFEALIHQQTAGFRKVHLRMLNRAFRAVGISSVVGESIYVDETESPDQGHETVVVVAPDSVYGWLGIDLWRSRHPNRLYWSILSAAFHSDPVSAIADHGELRVFVGAIDRISHGNQLIEPSFRIKILFYSGDSPAPKDHAPDVLRSAFRMHSSLRGVSTHVVEHDRDAHLHVEFFHHGEVGIRLTVHQLEVPVSNHIENRARELYGALTALAGRKVPWEQLFCERSVEMQNLTPGLHDPATIAVFDFVRHCRVFNSKDCMVLKLHMRAVGVRRHRSDSRMLMKALG